MSDAVAALLCEMVGCGRPKKVPARFRGNVLLSACQRQQPTIPRVAAAGLMYHEFLNMVTDLKGLAHFSLRISSDLVYEEFSHDAAGG